MRLIILVFAAVVLNINFALAQDSKHLRFGILAYRPKDITTAQWLPFTRELERALPGYTVELSVLMYPELDAEVKNHALDFVLTNPEHYILLKNSSGVNAIATLIKLENGHPTAKFAGVIFTRADRADIQKLEDLNGKTIASPAESSLGGYLMERWELEKRHVQARYSFTGMPHDKVVDEVLSGRADAGFVRSGLLESLARSGKLTLGANSPIRLLAPHSIDNDMPVLHSTEDYPEWAFAVAPHVNADTVRQVSLFLLQIKADSDMAKTAEIAGFNPPADYIPVEILMLRLNAHPNELKYFNFSDFIWRYRESFVVLAGSGLMFLIMILFLIRTNRRFKKIARENQKLLLAVEQSPVSVVITDLKADIEYVNRHFSDVTGYEFTEVAGKNPRLLQSGKMPKERGFNNPRILSCKLS